MTDSTAPASGTSWIVGPGSAPVRPDDDAGPLGEGEARWTRLTDETGFLDAVAALGPRLHELIARRRAAVDDRVHPFSHVRRMIDGWMVVTTPTVWYTESDLQAHTGLLIAVFGRDRALTYETGDAGIHDGALERLEYAGPPGPGIQRVAAAVLFSVLMAASEVEVALGEAVAETERLVFDEEVTAPVTRIYELKREIAEARRALIPVSAEIPGLAEPDAQGTPGPIEATTLERVVTAMERIDGHLNSHDGLLSDMLQVHLAQVSVQQNEDMRKISAWAAILVYPTIVAGIYGMNFARMPELSWLLGYPFALALMATGCFVLYRWFKRAEWL